MNMQSNGYNIHNDSGMLQSKVILDVNTKLSFIKRFLTHIISPTSNITDALRKKERSGYRDFDSSSEQTDINIIMSIFSSINIDADLFNLTIVEDNENTRIFQEIYDRNKFYMINTSPVIDKKTNNLVILYEFFKNALVEPLDFLDEIRNNKNLVRDASNNKSNILGYLYLKELVSLAQKNYKNKFTLANKARMYLYEHNPELNAAMRDEAAVSLAKMATDFHTNSMILDNINNDVSKKISGDIEYFKNSPFILYHPNLNYKMTHYDILQELLEDAIIEYLDFSEHKEEVDAPIQKTFEEYMNDDKDNNDDNNDNDANNNHDDHTCDCNCHDHDNDDNDDNEDTDGIDRNSAYSNRNSRASMNVNNDGNMEAFYNDSKMLKITFKKYKGVIKFLKLPPVPGSNDDRYDRLDSEDERGIDRIQHYINYGMQKLRGTGISEILENVGCPIEVDMAWEEEIIRYINNMTNMTNSNKNIATWSKSNIYTRHITTLPGRKPLPESTPIIYIMFDQSGSMDNNIIRKINYIIEYFYNKKYDINLFIHDDARNASDVKVYEFRPKSQTTFSDNYRLDKLISSRVMCGGTSHKGVFDLMEVYITDVTNTNKKYNIQYCLIASDLYSDIEEIYKNYKWINLINNNIFAITPTMDASLPFGKVIHIS